MKRLILVAICLLSLNSFGQLIDVFNYTGSLNANGWTTHSGATPGQLVTSTTPSDQGSSLNYAGLPAPTGNRAMLVSGNTEDVNIPVSGITGQGYFSFLLNVRNTTGLTAAGDHFFGFASTAGSTVTNFGARIWIKTGSVAGTFQIGIINSGSAGSYYSQDYPAGTTIMVVGSLDNTTSPTTAKLWINPTPGGTQPAPFVTSNSGATAFPAFASLYIRQGSAATGNLDLDEIRAGSTWASVTPSGVVSCITTSTISPSVCTTYTVPSGGETYTVSGVYHDTIPNAALCDSIITINLTVTGGTSSTISPSACTSYTVPSGSATYSASGTYTDVIPNHLGCDSTITINLTIVSSITYYADTDGDGLGDAGNTTTACTPPVGYVTNSNDCNDANASIGAATIWYLDSDGDTYGGSTTTTACTAPVGYVSNNTDCNDANATVYPGATEIPNDGIDQDCSGGDLVITPTALGLYEFTGNDCNGASLAVTTQPTNAVFANYAATTANLTCSAAANVINYSGWNTSGVVNPDQYYSFSVTPSSCYGLNLTEVHLTHKNSGSGGAPTIHLRSSLDGFASDVATLSIATPNTIQNDVITLPAQFATVYGAIEFRFYVTSMATTGATYRNDNVSLYGTINALPVTTYYADSDGDTYGDPATSITNCIPPAGYVSNNTDCNDNNAAEHPGASWAIDNDNDGFVGAATQVSCTQPVGYISSTAPADCNDNNSAIHGQTTYYADNDGDGFGNLAATTTACSQPVGYVTNSTDCDDNDNTVGAASTQYYIDADSDGYGNPNTFIFACSPQTGYVANFDDCNDNNPSVHPGATEVCDGEDNDCDTFIDEGVPTFTFYADADNDGLGDPNTTTTDCATPTGYVSNHSDCDDTDPTPGAGATVFYMDADSDGYGDDFNSISTCTVPVGYVAGGGDCNDGDNTINPDATDIPGNSIDENCDGVDGYLDLAEASLSNLVAYPNPGTSTVTLSFNGSLENATLRFLGVDGKAVNMGTTELLTSGITVSTLNLVPGIYFIEVSQGAAVKTVRWVKQ